MLSADGGSTYLESVCVAEVCSDDVDRCPDDVAKVSPAVCGCGVSDTIDQDSDGTPDCNDMCPGVSDRASNNRCGCDAASEDLDGDGVPNCRDECPHDGEKTRPWVCGCGTSDLDSDGDTMPDCADACPNDVAKVVPGSCGCGVVESTRDADNDGRLDCIDLCNGIDDARYQPITSCGVGYCSTRSTPSSCAAGVETECRPGDPLTTTDATCDGVDDDCDGQVDEDFASYSTTCGAGACVAQGSVTCVNGMTVDSCRAGTSAPNDATCDGVDDDCDGQLDEDYMPRVSACGVGACQSTGMTSCVEGAELDSCMPAAAAADDTVCNGIDDDCDGQVDEDYVPVPSSCGLGVCQRSGMRICSAGEVVDTCMEGSPNSANDGPPANDLDDDCDDEVDENACVDNAPRLFMPGSHLDIPVPPGCIVANVQLWGAGGGSGGQTSVGETGNPGRGGAGGYASAAVPVTGALNLHVGRGGAGCGAGGTNTGSGLNGGAGGDNGGNGGAGQDGMVSGGGAGASAGFGNGGRGHYGGGGGGSGALAPWPPYPGAGGGGGAATALLVGGTRAAVAGGGGGGGGANGSSAGSTGGAGGEGCSGNGGGDNAGGGGGGGVCVGTTRTQGSNGLPANRGSIPAGYAVGGTGVCDAGGNGYAIIVFSR